MSSRIEKIPYGGWSNCYRLSNSQIELIVTADIGPRVIRCGFSGGQNFFKEYAAELGGTGEPDWKIRGGHRIWVAPEKGSITYELDNYPVEISNDRGVFTATSPTDPRTGLQKELTLILDPTEPRVHVTERIYNRTLFPLEYAAWGPTVMAPGGLGITGVPPRGTHPEMLEPTHPLICWAYTNLADPRWKFTLKYITLRQDPHATSPQKIGLFNPKTFGAYVLNGEMFLKQSAADPSKRYPDMGCSYQSFTNQDMLELEPCGPLEFVPPGGYAELNELWTLHRPIPHFEITDQGLDQLLLDKLSL